MSTRMLSVCLALALILPACLVVDDGDDGGDRDPPSGSPQEECSFDCSGCCTDDGRCLPGTSELQCGWGGQACNECADNQQCRQAAGGGQCRACGPENCSGCCTLEGTCLAGTSDDACGTFGETCVGCPFPGYCAASGIGGGTCQ